ncbi:MAG: hypothetical protein K2L00_10115 [Muribaculaceae bacterium]|nr:hypothetical protein [Muribaculaceae bacterium]
MEKKAPVDINLIVTGAFVLFAYWIMAVKNGFMLRWYDEMSLFQPTWLSLRQYLMYPGGLLRYAGSWLTQLMYYPWLGTTAIMAIWLLTAWLTRKAFNLQKAFSPLALAVPFAMLVSVVQLDEAWLSIKTDGYVFSNTLGYLLAISLFLLFKSTSSHRYVSIAIGLLIPFLYAIGGFFTLLSTVLCVMQLARDGIRQKSYVCCVGTMLIIAVGIAVPLLYYRYLPGNSVDNDFPYLKGLPELLMEPYDRYLWKPFIVASTGLLLLWGIGLTGNIKRSKPWTYISIAAICCCGIWAVSAERKSEQLRATVLMLQAMDQNNWKKIIHVMSHVKEQPNYTMSVIYDLAKANLGGEPGDISGYYPINIDARHAESFTMTAFIQVPVNYYIGRFNQSYRWAMEHSVQYGKRVFFLKYMVKDALMNGEIKLAKRYNDMLLKTMYHRKWAREMNRYIEDPSLIGKNPEFSDVLQSSSLEKNRKDTDTDVPASQ